MESPTVGYTENRHSAGIQSTSLYIYTICVQIGQNSLAMGDENQMRRLVSMISDCTTGNSPRNRMNDSASHILK